MKIFYLCRTGHHTSLVAAAIHLSNTSGGPGYKENVTLYNNLTRIHGFNKINFRDIGRPFFVGVDEKDNEIYTIGVWKENLLMARAINDLIRLMDDSGQWFIIDTSPAISRWTKTGIAFKKMHLDHIAGALLKLGARREIPRLIKIVNENMRLISH